MFDLDLNAYLCKDIGRNIYKIKEEDMNILMESITGGTELAVLVNIIDVIYIKKIISFSIRWTRRHIYKIYTTNNAWFDLVPCHWNIWNHACIFFAHFFFRKKTFRFLQRTTAPTRTAFVGPVIINRIIYIIY